MGRGGGVDDAGQFGAAPYGRDGGPVHRRPCHGRRLARAPRDYGLRLGRARPAAPAADAPTPAVLRRRPCYWRRDPARVAAAAAVRLPVRSWACCGARRLDAGIAGWPAPVWRHSSGRSSQRCGVACGCGRSERPTKRDRTPCADAGRPSIAPDGVGRQSSRWLLMRTDRSGTISARTTANRGARPLGPPPSTRKAFSTRPHGAGGPQRGRLKDLSQRLGPLRGTMVLS